MRSSGCLDLQQSVMFFTRRHLTLNTWHTGLHRSLCPYILRKSGCGETGEGTTTARGRFVHCLWAVRSPRPARRFLVPFLRHNLRPVIRKKRLKTHYTLALFDILKLNNSSTSEVVERPLRFFTGRVLLPVCPRAAQEVPH